MEGCDAAHGLVAELHGKPRHPQQRFCHGNPPHLPLRSDGQVQRLSQNNYADGDRCSRDAGEHHAQLKKADNVQLVLGVVLCQCVEQLRSEEHEEHGGARHCDADRGSHNKCLVDDEVVRAQSPRQRDDIPRDGGRGRGHENAEVDPGHLYEAGYKHQGDRRRHRDAGHSNFLVNVGRSSMVACRGRKRRVRQR